MDPDRTDTQPDQRAPSASARRRRVKVVGHDGSPNGRRVVAGAARRLEAGDRLIVVHAQPAPEGASEELRQQILGELGATVPDGIEYELRVIDGPPAQALVEVALETEALGIIIGTREGTARLGQRTIRSELADGPIPVVALYHRAERESHPQAEPLDGTDRHGYDSFPASDPPSSWAGPPDYPPRDAPSRAPART